MKRLTHPITPLKNRSIINILIVAAARIAKITIDISCLHVNSERLGKAFSRALSVCLHLVIVRLVGFEKALKNALFSLGRPHDSPMSNAATTHPQIKFSIKLAGL